MIDPTLAQQKVPGSAAPNLQAAADELRTRGHVQAHVHRQLAGTVAQAHPHVARPEAARVMPLGVVRIAVIERVVVGVAVRAPRKRSVVVLPADAVPSSQELAVDEDGLAIAVEGHVVVPPAEQARQLVGAAPDKGQHQQHDDWRAQVVEPGLVIGRLGRPKARLGCRAVFVSQVGQRGQLFQHTPGGAHVGAQGDQQGCDCRDDDEDDHDHVMTP